MLNLVVGLPILIRKETFKLKHLKMAKLFTNEKETKRAIQAAVDQYERCKRSLQKVGKRKKRRSQSRMVRGRKEI